METHLKTVGIDLALPLADEARLRAVLVDMGYEWGVAIFQESDRSWVELHLPDDIHSVSLLRAVKHALRDIGSDALPSDPQVIG
jgi:hypothetical protein